MAIPRVRPIKYKNPRVLQEKIDAYFEDCNENHRPYTMSGLAVALGVDRHTLVNYGATDMFADIIARAKSICECYSEEALYTNRNVTGVMFSLKNNYDWKDKQEVSLDNHVRIEDYLEDHPIGF